MAEKVSLWAVFVGLVFLFIFTFWAASAYFSNPADIPMMPVLMAIIALLMVIGGWLFRVNAETKRKNIYKSSIRA